MNIERLLLLAGKLPYFDLATIAQLSGEKRHTLRVQLHRWISSGKVTPLRRGMYVMGREYRRVASDASFLANQMYMPSYLSFHWALGYYGLIPEAVVLYTNATTRSPRMFRNDFGSFRYTHIKTSYFFGYQVLEMDAQKVLIAMPEKALLDLWHIETGEWDTERMASMRFQNFELISLDRLNEYADKFHSPRLLRAVKNWQTYVNAETQGVREL